MSARRVSVFLASCLFAGAVAAGPADRQEIDPGFRADIEKLLAITGSADLGKQMATQMSSQILEVFKQQNPQVPPRAYDVGKEVLAEEFARSIDGPDGLMGEIVSIYARHFTPDEVKGLIEFYQTELGQKAIREMPQLMSEGMQAGLQWGQRIVPKLQETLERRLRQEGLLESTDTVKGSDIP